MKFTFNKQFMVLKFLLLKCFAKQITLKLTEAGTLPNKIGIGEKILVTNLKIIGEINGTDLRFIREMAGSDVKGNSTSGNLSVLDLSEAKFVAGGDYYYKDYEDGCYTSNDIIGKYAFRDCKSLTSVIIPSSVTEIREYAFDGCISLKNVNIPSSVTEIGCGAFGGCSSLTSVNIPSSVTKIEGGTFDFCTSLTSVNIPSSVTSIGTRAFWCCWFLVSVKIPSSVTEIECGAFSGCHSLTSVNIPSSVTSIGKYAFFYCSGLKSIYVYAETVPSIGAGAFNGFDSENCTLYVPKGTYDVYRYSWGVYLKIS